AGNFRVQGLFISRSVPNSSWNSNTSPKPEEPSMREFVRHLSAALSVACLAVSMTAVSTGGALAQAKPAPAQQAAPPQQPVLKQIVLTDKQIEGVIAASKDMDAITEKL